MSVRLIWLLLLFWIIRLKKCGNIINSSHPIFFEWILADWHFAKIIIGKSKNHCFPSLNEGLWLMKTVSPIPKISPQFLGCTFLMNSLMSISFPLLLIINADLYIKNNVLSCIWLSIKSFKISFFINPIKSCTFLHLLWFYSLKEFNITEQFM